MAKSLAQRLWEDDSDGIKAAHEARLRRVNEMDRTRQATFKAAWVERAQSGTLPPKTYR